MSNSIITQNYWPSNWIQHDKKGIPSIFWYKIMRIKMERASTLTCIWSLNNCWTCAIRWSMLLKWIGNKWPKLPWSAMKWRVRTRYQSCFIFIWPVWYNIVSPICTIWSGYLLSSQKPKVTYTFKHCNFSYRIRWVSVFLKKIM